MADPLIAKRNNNAVVDENGDGESKTKHVKLDEDDEATLREKYLRKDFSAFFHSRKFL